MDKTYIESAENAFYRDFWKAAYRAAGGHLAETAVIIAVAIFCMLMGAKCAFKWLKDDRYQAFLNSTGQEPRFRSVGKEEKKHG